MKNLKNVLLILFFLTTTISQVSSSREIIPKVYSADSLIVEEYPMNKEEFEAVFPVIRKNRDKWRKSPAEAVVVEKINKKIVPLGYKLSQIKGYIAFDFYKGGILIETGLSDIQNFSINKSHTHFVFFARKRTKNGVWGLFFRDNRVEAMKEFSKPYMNYFFYKFFPFYIDDNLISCQVNDKGHAEWEGCIKNSSQVLFQFSFLYGAGGMPIKFYQIGENWVLKIDQSFGWKFKSRIIVNGEDLCKRFNYSGMWCYHSIKGKTFFIFSYHRDSKFRISYNGKEIPSLWYDYIGSNGTLDIQVYETMVDFDARRGKQRYYVEAGVYE